MLRIVCVFPKVTQLMAGSEEGREGSCSCLDKLRITLLTVACDRDWGQEDSNIY